MSVGIYANVIMLKYKFLLLAAVLFGSGWGFFAHRKINRLAVFTLPVEMAVFYKKNIRYMEEAAVAPDRRRYIVPEEGATVPHLPCLDIGKMPWKNSMKIL
jgi:hypothetical protein